MCYGKIRIRQLAGTLVYDKERVKKGMILIGVDCAGYRTRNTTTITLAKGSKLIVGDGVRLCQGSSVVVGANASLQLKDRVRLGDGAEIICKDSISIGKEVDVTWDCQVTDFSSHPMRNKKTGDIHPMTKPVVIGDYCWIGNRTTVMPGTILPERIIVASNSLINKNYIEIGIKAFSVIGGIPAKLLNTDIERIDYK
jgi:acetyltransferase-like isoleucine patch superfamily enzyme